MKNGQLKPAYNIQASTNEQYVIDYTLAGPFVYTGIVGLDALGNVAFNYQYDELNFCGTAWNAIQIHWENLNLE